MADGTRDGLPYPEGDPGTLDSSAGRLRALAAAIAAEAAALSGAARDTSWRGPAAVVFHAVVGALASGLGGGVAALVGAAAEVSRLASELDHAQRTIERWAGEIQDARRRVEDARQGVHAAQRHAASGSLLGGPALAASPFDPDVLAAERRLGQATRELAELQARYRAKARHLCDGVGDADRSAAYAVMAAAAAAPSGGSAVPGARDVPTVVRMYAPVWLFHPKEWFLPTDAEPDLRYRGSVPKHVRAPIIGVSLGEVPFASVDGIRYPLDPGYLRGQGAGAPIYYRYRPGPGGGGGVIEYWVYRRHNDFRGVGAVGGAHKGDWEAVAVRLDRGNRPVRVGYSQHAGGCSLPWGEAPKRQGHPVSHAALGSAANYPWAGSYDEIPGPLDDLASGQGRGSRVVHGQDNPRDYDRTPLRGYDGHYGEDNSPRGPHLQDGKFAPGSETWRHHCEPPERRGG